MKIAAITDDGKTISQHFGRAAYYLVVTIQEGEVTGRELREKIGHAHFVGEGHHSPGHGQQHGYGPGAESRHARMAASIADCQVLLCGGMGRGAYESMKSKGIRPIVTDLQSIDESVMAFIQGSIADLHERLH